MPSSTTYSGMRYAVRTLAILYYPAFAPMLYDLFTQGLRPRAFYFFAFLVFSIGALQIGWKEPDVWVPRWYHTNTLLLAGFTAYTWLVPTATKTLALYPFEKYIHAGLLATALLGYLLDRVITPRQAPTDEEEAFPPVEVA